MNKALIKVNAEVAPGRRLKLEQGKKFLYDVAPQMVEEISEQFKTIGWQQKLEEASRKSGVLKETAEKIMEIVIEKGDGPYKDRTSEMMELVAEQTGIRFPHVFERYAELFLLTLKPKDKWNILQATREKLVIEVYSCSLTEEFKAGDECKHFCLGAFEAAAKNKGFNIDCRCDKILANDNCCKFSFEPEEK